MPSNPAKPFLVSRTDDPQLQRLNEKIARLAAAKPSGEAFGAFALAAHLADGTTDSCDVPNHAFGLSLAGIPLNPLRD